MKSPSTSFRLSQEAIAAIKTLADQLGISMAAVLELAIRDYAKKTKRHK